MTTPMAIIRFGYENYVLSVKDAVTLAEMLANAQRYEEKYKPGGNGSTHHIWECEDRDMASIRLISTAFYQGAKLAGRPE